MRDSLRLVIVLGLIATISGGVLAYVHQNMSPIIEENRAAAMAEAILEVMPKAVSYEVITAFTGGSALADATSSGSVADATSGSTEDGTSASTDGTSASTDGTSGSSVVVDVVTKYRGSDADGNTVGIAFAVDGNGFGGNIRMMVGLDPVTRKLTKVKVLDHLETPGLGARITEQAFLHQFENKSLDDAFTAKNDVDAITGATVSSQAVAATIKAALSEVEADLRAGGIW